MLFSAACREFKKRLVCACTRCVAFVGLFGFEPIPLCQFVCRELVLFLEPQKPSAVQFFFVRGLSVNSFCRFNPLNPELNPICYLLALLGAHHFLHVSRIRVKLLIFRLLMSYIYMEHPFLMFLDHTQRRSTVGRTPLDE